MKTLVLLVGVLMTALLFSGCSLLEECEDDDPYDEPYTHSMQTADGPTPRDPEMSPLSEYPQEECPGDHPQDEPY